MPNRRQKRRQSRAPAKENASAQLTTVAVKQQMATRGLRALNYVASALFLFIVYAVVALLDTLLANWILFLMQDASAEYQFLREVVNQFKIGIAIASLLGYIIHTVFSLAGQIKMEVEMMRE